LINPKTIWRIVKKSLIIKMKKKNDEIERNKRGKMKKKTERN
jgi:hypothetical protein